MTAYSFGDTELAAERLRVLDGVFAMTSDALLDAVPPAPAPAADLGCGPGATTVRLTAHFPEAEVTGFDASEAFLTAARAAVPAAAFVAADVTRPLRGAPYDLVYARFLLAHLPDIGAAIRTWTDALTSGSVLVLEETEHIESADPWFERYEKLSDARVTAAGANVYAGTGITAAISAASPTEVEVVVDRVLELDVTAGDAAAMFWRNLATWGADAVAQGLVDEAGRDELLDHLRARVSDPARGLFTWTHHQTILRRT